MSLGGVKPSIISSKPNLLSSKKSVMLNRPTAFQDLERHNDELERTGQVQIFGRAETDSEYKRTRELSPRTDFDSIRKHLTRLTINMIMTLDVAQIKAIADDFDCYPESSCSQPEFVEVMLRHLRLTQLHTTPLFLVWALNELFDSMDLDGDKSLEFDEFLATVVHMGMGGSDQMVLDPAKPYDEGKKFRSHSKFNIEQLVQYVPMIDAVLVLEPDSSLSLCDATTMAPVRTMPLKHTLMAVEIFTLYLEDEAKKELDKKAASAQQQEQTSERKRSPRFQFTKREGVVKSNGTVKIGDTVTLLVGASSNRFYLWETHDKSTDRYEKSKSKQPFSDKTRNHQMKHTNQTFKLSDERKTRVPIVHIKWIERTKQVVTGSANGLIQLWKIGYEHDNRVLKHQTVPGAKLSKRFRLVRVSQIRGHTENITSICSIDSMELLVTAGMDRQIRVHDTQGITRMVMDEGHRTGIVAVDYSNHYRFIISAGIDHNICVWSPFAERMICKLTGHAAPLLGVQFVTGTPQIVSADTDGWVKVWDARNFRCVQTLMTVHSIVSFTTMTAAHMRILVSGRNSSIVSYDQQGGPHAKLIELEEPVFNALYNETLLTFCTTGRRNIKLWNALNGELLCVYRGLTDDEITAVCLDSRQRKIILGDHLGRIRVYNYSTGAYMKSLSAHNAEIAFLAYDEPSRLVVSASCNMFVKVHDERPIEDTHVLMSFKCPGYNAEISACAFSSDKRGLSIATTSHAIYQWNLDTGVREGDIHGSELVTCMTYLTRKPVLVTGNDAGVIACWFVRPSPFKCVKAFTFKAYGLNNDYMFPLTVLCVDPDNNYLYTGDARGQISCWNLKSIIFSISQQEIKMGEVKRRATAEQHYSIDLLNGMVTLSNIKPIWTIDAHDSAISSLQLVPHPHCLISAARTANVNMWEPLTGASMGLLDSAKTLNDHAQRNNHDEPQEKLTDDDELANTLPLDGNGLSTATPTPVRAPTPSAMPAGWGFVVDVEPREVKARQLARDVIDALENEDDSVLQQKYGMTYTPFDKLDQLALAAEAEGSDAEGSDGQLESESYDDMNGVNLITERLKELEYEETEQEQEVAARNRSVIGYMDPADRKKSMQRYLESRFHKRVQENRGNIQRAEEEAALLAYELDDAYNQMAEKYGNRYKAGQRTTKIGNSKQYKEYRAKMKRIAEEKKRAQVVSRGQSPGMGLDTESSHSPIPIDKPRTPQGPPLPGEEGARTNVRNVSSKFRRQSQIHKLQMQGSLLPKSILGSQSMGALPTVPQGNESSGALHSAASQPHLASEAIAEEEGDEEEVVPEEEEKEEEEDEEEDESSPSSSPLSSSMDEQSANTSTRSLAPSFSLPVLSTKSKFKEQELKKQVSFRFEHKIKAKMAPTTLTAAERLERVMHKFKGMDTTLAKRQPKKLNKLAII